MEMKPEPEHQHAYVELAAPELTPLGLAHQVAVGVAAL